MPTAVFVLITSAALAASGLRPPDGQATAVGVPDLVQNCAAGQSARLAVTIDEDGRVADVVSLRGDEPFLSAASDAIGSLLRPPSAPPLDTTRPFVETVVVTCAAARPGPAAGSPRGVARRRGWNWLRVEAVYPSSAREEGITGQVIVQAEIGADGLVRQADVRRTAVGPMRVSTDPALEAAAVYAVRQWRFLPTYRNGVAVPVLMTVSVPFAVRQVRR